MRHLVIGQRQKASNFSAFHWSPHGCLITIGQHFVTMKVVHLPKRTETSLITESDQSRANHQLLQLCTVHAAWSDSDQAVRAMHSCKSWFLALIRFCFYIHTGDVFSLKSSSENCSGQPTNEVEISDHSHRDKCKRILYHFLSRRKSLKKHLMSFGT